MKSKGIDWSPYDPAAEKLLEVFKEVAHGLDKIDIQMTLMRFNILIGKDWDIMMTEGKYGLIAKEIN